MVFFCWVFFGLAKYLYEEKHIDQRAIRHSNQKQTRHWPCELVAASKWHQRQICCEHRQEVSSSTAKGTFITEEPYRAAYEVANQNPPKFQTQDEY